MFSKMKIALSIAVSLGAASTAFAGALPSIDIPRMCRASNAALSASDNPANNFETCLHDEQEAREQLIADWVTFPATDRAHCVLPAEFLPSYTEWLTCLEMERDMRKARKERADRQSDPAPADFGVDGHSHFGATRKALSLSSGSRPLRPSNSASSRGTAPLWLSRE